jgi:hypothetical protein
MLKDMQCSLRPTVMTRGTNFAETRRVFKRLATYRMICQPLQKYNSLLIAYLHELILAHVLQNHHFCLLKFNLIS